MCTVSFVGDDYRRTFPDRWPKVDPWRIDPIQPFTPTPEVSKEDFEKLKREVEELKKLLKAAKRFDDKTGQKDCEMDDKIEFIRKVAKFVGVDIDEVFEPKKASQKKPKS
jgi:hypothetical protein